MHFTSESISNGVLERDFSLGDVPGVLWSPASVAGPSPLVLIGHPGGLHKKAPGVVARATHYVTTLGFQVAAIDAPGHGDRPRSEADAEWVAKIGAARRAGEPLGAIVSEFNADLAARAVPEWIAAIDELVALPEVAAGPIGYSGMTVGTEIGARLVVADDRIGAAILGGVFAWDGMVEVFRRITIPVQYLLAWDDPEIDRESTFILFDELGSEEKTLHANAGSHRQVPLFETEDSGRFLARHLR
jgi:dienelactone hydrolase